MDIIRIIAIISIVSLIISGFTLGYAYHLAERQNDLRGEKGDIGEQGIQGVQGIQGIQGLKGDKGDSGIDCECEQDNENNIFSNIENNEEEELLIWGKG